MRIGKDEIIYLPDDGFSSRRVLGDAEIEAYVCTTRELHRNDEAKSTYTEAEILAELDIQD